MGRRTENCCRFICNSHRTTFAFGSARKKRSRLNPKSGALRVRAKLGDTENVLRPNLQSNLFCVLVKPDSKYELDFGSRPEFESDSCCVDFRQCDGKSETSSHRRLGRRSFSVSPNFAQTRTAPLLGLGRLRKTVPTQTFFGAPGVTDEPTTVLGPTAQPTASAVRDLPKKFSAPKKRLSRP